MTFSRRSLTRSASIAVSSLLFASAAFAQASPPTAPNQLQAHLDALAKRAHPATFGVAVIDLQSGATWGVHADQPFPMMSVFKAPVAAAILAQVDAGKLSLDQKVTIKRADVDPGSAVPSVGDSFRGEQMSFTLRELLKAAVSQSDNTAVDALIKVAGGPEVVTQFLRAKGIPGMRIDEDEVGVAKVFANLRGAAAPPANETAAQKDQRLRAGYQAFLADPRNRTSPADAALFLTTLWTRRLLTPASTQYLLDLMYAQTIPHRMRDGLPPQVRLADKTGTSGTVNGVSAAYNDIGILTWPNGRTVIVAAFLAGSSAPQADKDALFAALARETVAALQH